MYSVLALFFLISRASAAPPIQNESCRPLPICELIQTGNIRECIDGEVCNDNGCHCAGKLKDGRQVLLYRGDSLIRRYWLSDKAQAEAAATLLDQKGACAYLP